MDIEKIYTEIMDEEKKRIDDMIKYSLYNTVMNLIGEKPVNSTIFTNDYKSKFTSKGVDKLTSKEMVLRLEKDVLSYEHSVQQEVIHLMTKNLGEMKYLHP